VQFQLLPITGEYMTLGQLVVDVIKDIVKNGDSSVNEQNLIDGLLDEDPQYSDLVNNALPSINKAIARLVVQKKLPFKFFEQAVSYDSELDVKKSYKKYTLTLPSDFYTIVSIVYEDGDGRLENVQWQTLSKTQYLLPIKKDTDGKFLIQYSTKVPVFYKADIAAEYELEDYQIDDLMAQFITFFTRADLWETEQPTLAQTYRRYAEEYFDQIENPVMAFRQEQVHTKYHGDI
jgi:hypothetical protein